MAQKIIAYKLRIIFSILTLTPNSRQFRSTCSPQIYTRTATIQSVNTALLYQVHTHNRSIHLKHSKEYIVTTVTTATKATTAMNKRKYEKENVSAA